MNIFNDIKEFHEKFGLEYKGGPRMISPELFEFRSNFMMEELREYVEAMGRGDATGALDALVDLTYVVLGTAYVHGFDFNQAWERVHRANMRKVRAARPEDSKRGSGFDVVKPPGWEPPDLTDLATFTFK